jgi:hypothetical protein
MKLRNARSSLSTVSISPVFQDILLRILVERETEQLTQKFVDLRRNYGAFLRLGEVIACHI